MGVIFDHDPFVQNAIDYVDGCRKPMRLRFFLSHSILSRYQVNVVTVVLRTPERRAPRPEQATLAKQRPAAASPTLALKDPRCPSRLGVKTSRPLILRCAGRVCGARELQPHRIVRPRIAVGLQADPQPVRQRRLGIEPDEDAARRVGNRRVQIGRRRRTFRRRCPTSGSRTRPRHRGGRRH
jgi:hypothetical protein